MRITLQPSGAFEHLAGQLQALMEEMEHRTFFHSPAPIAWRPRLNLYETTDGFVVCVELAGMIHDRIDVRVENGVLHIRGERDLPCLPRELGETSVHLMEIACGPFHRQIPLTADVDMGRITALYRHGYLWVTLPRAARSEGSDCA